MIPIKYGIKSLKRIGKITLSNTRPRDYWAERGYDWYSAL
jgi:DMSO/TMAO reductase YedYZ molybdopterin-dependent catalytic subunit